MPAYSIRLMRNGTEAEITGGFKYGLTDDFIRILRASPQIRVVHLNSIGGRVGEAEKLHGLIRDRGLITYVSRECHSACTLAFAGGRERWLREGAVLGFHPGWSELDIAAAARTQKSLFLAAGFKSDFVSRALGTPNKDMWMPSASELLSAKVITPHSPDEALSCAALSAAYLIGSRAIMAHPTGESESDAPGSISTGGSSWSSTVPASPPMQDCWPIASWMKPCLTVEATSAAPIVFQIVAGSPNGYSDARNWDSSWECRLNAISGLITAAPAASFWRVCRSAMAQLK